MLFFMIFTVFNKNSSPLTYKPLGIMRILLFYLATFATLSAMSQDGGLDTSFGDYGTVQTDINGETDLAYSIVQQTDGKLLMAGMTTIQGEAFPSIVRYRLDGTLDSSFGNNAVAVFNRPDYQNEYYSTILNQNDGKILVGGAFYINSTYQYAVHRFLPNGSIDTDFGNNGELIIFPNSRQGNLKLLQDGSFLAGGRITDNGIFHVALKKYLPNGTLDTSFGNNGVVLTSVGSEASSSREIALTHDNKIVVLADSRSNNTASHVLLRYLSNGGLDTSFGNNGIVDLTNDEGFKYYHIAVYNDGKVAVTSSLFDGQLERYSTLITRYLSNGDLDTSFGNNGNINPDGYTLLINKIEVQENQRLLVYGELSDLFEGGGPFFMRRYYTTGHLDTGFQFNTPSYAYFVTDMLIQQDGKIVCLAHTPWYDGQEDIIMERHLNNTLSIPEFETQNAIIYPNPSTGIFIFKHGFHSENEAYQITDITGKIIFYGNLENEKTQLDLSLVQSGVYFLKTNVGVFRLMKN